MEQADTSIDDQMNSMEYFAEEYDMELADALQLVGKSGSIKANLEAAMDEIIARKRSGERIDVVLFYDQSRFGRSGPLHFGALADRLLDEGIEIAETDAFMEDANNATMVRMMKAMIAQQTARGIADNSARGSQQALREGRRSHASKGAYGIDRLYMTEDDEPICIIRLLPDGTRLNLDPETKEVRLRYEPGKMGFKKEKKDKVTLIPGDPEHQAVVIRIFAMRHEQGFAGTRIARVLNDEEIPSPNGKRWTKTVIDAMLRNETYCGVGYANRHSSALYFNQAEGRPEPLPREQGRRIRGIRPESSWYLIAYPKLRDYLPEHLRRAAMAEQAEHRAKIKSGWIKDPARRNGRTTHLLSDILVEPTTGKRLIAKRSRGRIYYGLNKSIDMPAKGSQRRRWLASGPLHRAVLEEIEALICSLPDLRERIIKEIGEQDKQRRGESGEAEQLLANLDKLKARLKSQVRRLGGDDDDIVNDAIDETTRQIRVIEDKLAGMNGGPALTEKDIAAITDGVIKDLSAMLQALAEEGETSLRKVAETLISSAVANLDENEVDFEFAIPAELIEQRNVRLAARNGPAPCRQAYKWRPIPLDAVTVDIPKRCSGDCWEPFEPSGCDDCRRQPKAA
jgi:DNA invertase Pin-like site-specific DNA recombinase/F0F1-type ATP synthase membrane subunit b/b'